MTNGEARQYLNASRNNIDRIRELSAMSGVSYCCMGKLEQRQAELEYALGNGSRRASRGNLGFPLIPVIGTALFSAIVVFFRWTQVKLEDAKAIIEQAECNKVAYEQGMDPGTICPVVPPVEKKSAIDQIMDIAKLAAIIAVVGLAFGVYKGFGKKT
jgi:hypothetical protein